MSRQLLSIVVVAALSAAACGSAPSVSPTAAPPTPTTILAADGDPASASGVDAAETDGTTEAAGTEAAERTETDGTTDMAPPSVLAYRDPTPLATPSRREGVDDLGEHAAAAFVGYLDAAGEVDLVGAWVLDLGSARMADRAALGAIALGVPFERDGRHPARLSGPEIPTEPLARIGLTTTASPDAARARLEAVAELGGTHDGLLVRTGDRDAAERVIRLAERLGLSPRATAGAEGFRVDLPDPADRAVVASWRYVCAHRVPGAGSPDCATPSSQAWVESFDTLDPAEWRVATTGPLADRERDDPPTEAGGVSWTNGEAQVYRPGQVRVRDGSLRLVAEPSPVVSVDTTPFVSGMVVSERRLGWGRIEADVVVPRGAGLWPAVWLLPVGVCEAPGRCPGYESPGYVEVDVLETIGHEPGGLHTSVHWFDGTLRSASTVHDVGIDDSRPHTVWADWRPGVITYGVGDTTLFSVATAIERDSPLAAAPDHRLVLNLAVGGRFAGEGLLGPTSPWWGDTSPPPGWPTLDWDRAVLVVDEVRFTPLR